MILKCPEREHSMKILLTGGAGYIGSACLRWLLRHGHDPIAYDNLSRGTPRPSPSVAAWSSATSPTPTGWPRCSWSTASRP